MVKKIIFQKCNFNYIYFLPLIAITFIEIQTGLYNYLDIQDKEYEYSIPYKILYLYLSNLSDFLAIIPLLIRRKCMKKKEENNSIENPLPNNKDNQSSESKLIFNDIKLIELNKKTKYFFVIFFFNCTF